MGSLWSGIWDEVYFAYQRRADKVKADKEGLVVAADQKISNDTEIHPGQAGEQVRYAGDVTTTLIPAGKATDTYYDYESRNYVNDINREHVQALSAYDETGTTRGIYTYGNERLTFSDGTDTFTYAYTGLQSVSALTDKNGVVVSNYTYAAWGIYAQTASNLTDITGSYSENTRTSISRDGNYAATNATAGSLPIAYLSGATSNPYSFNAEYTDESTGFIFLRARYYDAVSGTFLTQDSYAGNAFDALSQNRYTYAEDDPVNYVDPSGHRVVAAMMADTGGKKAAQNYYKQKKNDSARNTQALRQEQNYLRNANKSKVTRSAGGIVSANVQKQEQIEIRQHSHYSENANKANTAVFGGNCRTARCGIGLQQLEFTEVVELIIMMAYLFILMGLGIR